VARLRQLLILGALSAFAPLSIDMYLPSLPRLARDFHSSPSAIQATLTTCLIGLAAGQLLAGPISDARGRRPPLLIGLAVFAAASAGCAAAPSAGVLALLRLLQGLSGASAIVIARAVVSDRYRGADAARYFAVLTLVSGLAPIIAPLLGAQILALGSWRWVFVVLAGAGALLIVAVWAGLPESLPGERRRAGGIRDTLGTLGRLGRDRTFAGYTLAMALAFTAMFAYISGSPFVLQDIYGASPRQFSFIFAANSLGIVLFGRASAVLVRRVPARRLLVAGVLVNLVGGVSLLAVALAGGGLVLVLIPLFLVASSIGLVFPNATALALELHPEAIGSASAAIGVTQFAVAAALAPLVGIGGQTTAIAMAAVMAGCGLAALVALPRRVRSSA
jgi:DHA1 family bicyclomycin/chloramphenicol resistance-like MFS transporter